VGFSYVVTLTATCAIYYIKFGERNNKKREIKEAEAEPEVNEDLDAEPVFESVTRIDEIYKTTTI
jgi:hypothetical protein